MWFSRKVNVRFVDQAGRVFAKSAMPPEQLPESFLWETTMNIGEQRYRVVKAEPPLRADFAKTKQLELTLVPVEESIIDPNELLFSLPTIADALPADHGAADDSEVLLYEDDWRQLELVHASHAAAIEAELAAIGKIYEEHRAGSGFKTVHVRKAIPAPLPEGLLRLDDVAFAGVPRPARFHGHGARIDGGFAANVEGGWLLYGTEQRGALTTLALQRGAEAPDFTAAITALARARGLVLVDWVAGAHVMLSREDGAAAQAT